MSKTTTPNMLTGDKGGKREELGERWDLIPYVSLRWIARVYAYGAAKYAPNNWHNIDFESDQSPLSHGIAHAYEATEFEPGSAERIWLLAKAAWNLIAQIWFESKLGKCSDDDWRELLGRLRNGDAIG